MGIPKFFSRVREYGTTNEIGRRSTTSSDSQSQSQSQSQSHCQSTKLAIVDGPSLAHFLFEQLSKEGHADLKAQCFYRYATLGEKAIEWLDNLRSFGFEIEGIYFDGALPSSKRGTRLDRLQKQTDALTKYKQRARYAKDNLLSAYDPTQAYCYKSILQQDRQDRRALEAAYNNLPTPPFLVPAVIEALSGSKYAEKTWVVDGEADTFCVAAAFETVGEDFNNQIQRTFSIFTNDSDLLIYRTRPNVRVVMIREISEHEHGNERRMRALCFEPTLLARLGSHQLPALVKPAFLMLDPKVTFRQAINNPQVDEMAEPFIRFAAQFELRYAAVKVVLQRDQRKHKKEVIVQDPRTSELIRHYLWALLKDQKYEAAANTTEPMKKRKLFNTSRLSDQMKPTMDAVQAEQEPANPFENKESSGMKLDMFLPALLEDPAKSAAWRIGQAFRSAAETLLLLPFEGYDMKLFEYKRSGDKVIGRQVHRSSIKRLGHNMTAYLEYTRNALLAAKELDKRSQWRFAVMQWTTSDMDQVENNRAGKQYLTVGEIVQIVNGEASTSWSAIHLFARYQAEYYSLRMLKETLDFCRDRDEFKRLDLLGSLNEFADELSGLPGIAEFFSTTDPDIDEEKWQKLHEQFLEKQEVNEA